jgi:competence protein ComEA
MFKKLIVLLAMFAATAAFAAVDINKANVADLESVKGIGTSVATKILDERKKSPFKDWNDLVDRVQGVGPGNAAKFSEGGLTVNGASFNGVPAAAKTAKADKAPKKVATDKPITKEPKK